MREKEGHRDKAKIEETALKMLRGGRELGLVRERVLKKNEEWGV